MKAQKELIKSMMLVTLLVSAFFMSQAIFYDDAFAQSQSTGDDAVDSKIISAYMIPQSFYISFGGMSYTKVYGLDRQETIWGEVRPVLLGALSKSPSVTPIDQAAYVEAFKNESLLIKMPMAFSAKDLFSVLTNVDASHLAYDGSVREVLMLSGEPNKLYLYDGGNGYFRLDFEVPIHDVSQVVDSVKTAEYVEYRTIADRFSLEQTVGAEYNQKNYVLVPFEYKRVVPMFQITPPNEAQETSEIVDALFGAQMNFVKELTDVNGSKIYMYGYGERILTLAPDGTLVYKAQYQPTEATPMTFKGAVNRAIGALERFNVDAYGLYLSGVERDPDDSALYSVYFGYHIGRYKLVDSPIKQQPIVVKVKDNQVLEFTNNIRSMNLMPSYTGVTEMFRVDKSLEKNSLEVTTYYLQDRNIYASNEEASKYFFEIQSEIRAIDMRYYEVAFDGGVYFKPVWQVDIAGRLYLFDAYEGTLLKTFKN